MILCASANAKEIKGLAWKTNETFEAVGSEYLLKYNKKDQPRKLVFRADSRMGCPENKSVFRIFTKVRWPGNVSYRAHAGDMEAEFWKATIDMVPYFYFSIAKNDKDPKDCLINFQKAMIWL